MIRGVPTGDPRVATFVLTVRERCAGRASHDRPLYDIADSLRAEWRRRGELVNLAPSDEELIEREIRRCTGT
jgi:hypothetical protein